MFKVSSTGQIRESLIELPDDQFFDETLAPPDWLPVTRKMDALPHPLDLLVLNAMHGERDLHCFEIAKSIYQMTSARIEVSHKQVWLALRRLGKANWVESSSRDPDAGRRKSQLYRLKKGIGSHLRSENKRWRRIAPLITRVAELSQ